VKKQRIKPVPKTGAPKRQIVGAVRGIGILVNPRYTHFMNATAHRGAHDGTFRGFNGAKQFVLLSAPCSHVPGHIALHRKAVKRAV
jgi:hypothetical protein